MDGVGLIGAGSVGRALGRSLTRAGIDVVYGVRDPASSTDLPGPARPVTDVVAARDVLFLVVPANAAVQAAAAVADHPARILVDCTNPLRWENGPVWSPPAEGSVAAQLARAYPAARVVKGFNHFGAEIQADPSLEGGPADALFASDDADAKSIVMQLAERMGFRPLDAGPLRNAGLLESLAVLWIHLATVTGLGREVAIRHEGRAR